MRINKDHITIRIIEKDDMPFIQKLWGDKETMLSSGGVYNVTDEMYDQLFEVLNNGEDINNHYIILLDDEPIGDLNIRKYSEEQKVCHADFKLIQPKRNKGYGKKVLDLLLDYYFNELKGDELYFELWLIDYFVKNKLIEYGFEEKSVNEDAVVLTLTKNQYEEGFNV